MCSSEYCEIFKNIYFKKHLRTAASIHFAKINNLQLEGKQKHVKICKKGPYMYYT